MIVKEARKPSSDPVQEKLRQEKAAWNKETSAFVSALINFKKLMNGQPSKFFMQKSMIKNPIPSDPAMLIADLVDDFQSIVQKAKNITEHQLAYSKTRKKKQPQAPVGIPSETPPPADLTQQLTQGLRAASLESQLVVEASNPLSRFISKFRGSWFGDTPESRLHKYRKSLLKSTLELDKEFSKMEDEIIGSSPESIFIAARLLKKVGDRLAFLSGSVHSFQMGSERDQEPTQTDSPQILKAQDAVQDFLRHESNFKDLNLKLKKELHDLHAQFLRAAPTEKEKIAIQVLEVYRALLDATGAKHGIVATDFRDLLNKIQDLPQEMPKEASLMAQGSFLTKWLGKLKHKVSPFDKTSALRLDIYRLIGETRTLVDHMMNDLEKDLDLDAFQRSMTDIMEKVASMQELMTPLISTIKEKMLDPDFMKKFKSQHVLDYRFDVADPMFQKTLQQWRRREQLKELVGR